MTCEICHQPECAESIGGERPEPGGIPSRLLDGQHEYRGYGEWAVHPNEAMFVLHRGYAIVDGERARVTWLFNEAFVTQIQVQGTFPDERPADGFIDSAFTGARPLHAIERAA